MDHATCNDLFVSPAKAGAHAQCNLLIGKHAWIPAYAGMTKMVNQSVFP